MPNGTYGIKKPAYIKSSDVDIFYHYRPSRDSNSTEFTSFKKLDSNLLSQTKADYSDTENYVLPGMYNMKLPLDKFSKVGIYTIYIKPKELQGMITDVSTLAAYPNIRGVVLDASNFGSTDATLFNNGGLIGYRIEYFDESGTNREDYYRIITSNNRCEPLAQNLSDTNAKGIRYRFNSSSPLIFCTVTPSSSVSFNNSDIPYIGKTGQKISLVNTKFNPIMLEVEMVDHDIDTVYNLMSNDQIRDLDNGLITTFDDNGNIIHQAMYGNITNSSEGINHDFKIINKDITSFDQESDLQKIKQNI